MHVDTPSQEQPKTATVTLLLFCCSPAFQESAFCSSGKNTKISLASSGYLSVLLCMKLPCPVPYLCLTETTTTQLYTTQTDLTLFWCYQKVWLPVLYSHRAVSGVHVLPLPSSCLDVYQIEQSEKTCPTQLRSPLFLPTRWGQQPSNMQVLITFPKSWVGRVGAAGIPHCWTQGTQRQNKMGRALHLYYL